MLARRRHELVAYLIGGFGLAMSAQANFLVPLRARELGADFDVIGLIVGAGALSAAATSVTCGAIIDRLGPKRAYLLGVAATAVTSLAFLAVDDYRWFLLLQLVHGVARNLGWVASQGYITTFASPEQRPRMTGRFSFFGNLGQMVGPIAVGATAGAVGYRAAFLVLVAYAAVFAVLGLLLADVRAPSHGQQRRGSGLGFRAAIGLVAERGMQAALLLTFARLWTSHLHSTFFPIFLVENEVDPGIAGTLVATSGLVAALMAPTTGWWTRWVSPFTATTLGLGCGALGLALAPIVTTVPQAALVPALVGIGSGLSLPLLISIVTAAAPDDRRGLALGLRGLVNQGAATAAPVLIGPMMAALGLAAGFVTGGAAAAAVLCAATLLARRTQPVDAHAHRDLGVSPPNLDDKDPDAPD